MVLSGMPDGMGQHVLRYLGLFRKPGAPRGLPWPKALRLSTELADMVRAGDISWKSGLCRSATPAMWMEGMLEIMDRAQAGKLTLPLESHGYLRSIVYGLADKVEAESERQIEEQRRSPYSRPCATLAAERPDFESMAAGARKCLDMLRKNANEGPDAQ